MNSFKTNYSSKNSSQYKWESPSDLRKRLIKDVCEILSTKTRIPRYKKGVILIGNTGVGKSTLTNIVSGVPVIPERNQRGRLCFAVGNTEKKVAKIGQIPTESETQEPNYADISPEVKIIDCPGIFDTKGWYFQILGATYMQKIMKEVENMKLALMISSKDFGARCRNINQFFENVREMFSNMKEDASKSLYKNTIIIISKISPLHQEDDIKEIYKSASEHLSRYISRKNIMTFKKPKYYNLVRGTSISKRDLSDLISRLKKDNFSKNIRSEISLTPEAKKELYIMVKNCEVKHSECLDKMFKNLEGCIIHMQTDQLQQFDKEINNHEMKYEEYEGFFLSKDGQEFRNTLKGMKECVRFLKFAPKLDRILEIKKEEFKQKNKKFNDRIKKRLKYEIKKQNTKSLLGDLCEKEGEYYQLTHISALVNNLKNGSFIKDEQNKIPLTKKADKHVDTMWNNYMDKNKECSEKMCSFIETNITDMNEKTLLSFDKIANRQELKKEEYKSFISEKGIETFEKMLTTLQNHEYFLTKTSNILHITSKVKRHKEEEREFNDRIKKRLKYEIKKRNTENLLACLPKNKEKEISPSSIGNSLLDGLQNRFFIDDEQGKIPLTAEMEKKVNAVIGDIKMEHRKSLNMMCSSIVSNMSDMSIKQLLDLDVKINCIKASYDDYKEFFLQETDRKEKFENALKNLRECEPFLTGDLRKLNVLSKVKKQELREEKRSFDFHIKNCLLYEINVRNARRVLEHLRQDKDNILNEIAAKIDYLENKSKGFGQNKNVEKKEKETTESIIENFEIYTEKIRMLRQSLSGLDTQLFSKNCLQNNEEIQRLCKRSQYHKKEEDFCIKREIENLYEDLYLDMESSLQEREKNITTKIERKEILLDKLCREQNRVRNFI